MSSTLTELVEFIRVSLASSKPSSRRYDREHTPYGICVNTRTSAHYLFNRDYLVLPLQLPPRLLRAALEGGFHHRRSADGHGKYRPEVAHPEEWMTAFFFNDRDALTWRKKTIDYDKSKYE
jgi:hypothetical protein